MELANAICEVVENYRKRGMGLDEVIGVGVGVLADHARAEYSDAYLDSFADIAKSRIGQPLPQTT